MSVIKRIERKIRENREKAEYWRKIEKEDSSYSGLADFYESVAKDWEKIKEGFIKEAKEIIEDLKEVRANE